MIYEKLGTYVYALSLPPANSGFPALAAALAANPRVPPRAAWLQVHRISLHNPIENPHIAFVYHQLDIWSAGTTCAAADMLAALAGCHTQCLIDSGSNAAHVAEHEAAVSRVSRADCMPMLCKLRSELAMLLSSLCAILTR